MTISEAHEKAKQGGFKPRMSMQIWQIYLLDRDWWAALGKTMGWGEICLSCHNNVSFCCEKRYNENWLYHWHKFIDHLAEGKTAEDYFSKLTTPPQTLK